MEMMFLALAFVIGVIIYFYNRLIKNLNFVKDAWSGIEVQLTKRHDLIPMLVKTVRVYSKYEFNLL